MIKIQRCQKGLLHPQLDRPVLFFLWEWKLASTQAISLKFYPNLKQRGNSVYRRLLRLEQLGYIRRKADEMESFRLWTLTKKGFGAIRPLLPPLKQEGFESEKIRHDRFVMAAHLGDHLANDEKSVARFTEQQLRRFELECYPEWIPTDASHRSDGYWNVPTATSRNVISLEVELSRKTNADYSLLGDFYDRNLTVGNVLWVVSQSSQATSIYKALKFQNTRHRSIHSFFLLDELRSHGWKSKCIYGEKVGETFSSFLGEKYWNNNGKTVESFMNNYSVSAMLENRTSAYDLDT